MDSSKPTPYQKAVAKAEGLRMWTRSTGEPLQPTVRKVRPETSVTCTLFGVEWENPYGQPSHLHLVAETGPERIQWIRRKREDRIPLKPG
ncbi:hypothetical protein NN561_016776 [Cricetulus griseus]